MSIACLHSVLLCQEPIFLYYISGYSISPITSTFPPVPSIEEQPGAVHHGNSLRSNAPSPSLQADGSFLEPLLYNMLLISRLFIIELIQSRICFAPSSTWHGQRPCAIYATKWSNIITHTCSSSIIFKCSKNPTTCPTKCVPKEGIQW